MVCINELLFQAQCLQIAAVPQKSFSIKYTILTHCKILPNFACSLMHSMAELAQYTDVITTYMNVMTVMMN